MRRALFVLAGAAALIAVPSSAALAYINAPGTPVRGGASGDGTYNQLPVTGTCTIQGVTTQITEFLLNLVNVADYVEATPTGLVYRYSLTANCDTDYVLGRFTVAPLAYSIDDTAGTLTFTGMSVPASFTGETIADWPGTATLTAGSGPLGPVVFGADNATEKSQVVSYHKQITRAKTDADRARYINELQRYLES